jgi:hypothetical protein
MSSKIPLPSKLASGLGIWVTSIGGGSCVPTATNLTVCGWRYTPQGQSVDFEILRLGQRQTLRTTIEKRDTQEAIDAQSEGIVAWL